MHWVLVLVLVGAASGPAVAQSFPCERARTAPERAICTVPSLSTLDRAVASAFNDALRREPANAPAVRSAQQQWLRGRDSTCAVPAPRLAECLTRQMTARLAALAPPPEVVAAVPSVQAAASQPLLPPREPSIPGFVPPDAAAALDAAVQPAAAVVGTLLRVVSPGRFTLRTHSTSGASLQVSDMLVGPSEEAGQAGVQDGRLDLLLDAGVYKLRAKMAEGAAGEVRFSVTPFRSAARPIVAPAPGVLSSTTLADGEQRSFWLEVGADATLRVDAAGRALSDLRLWRNGSDLASLEPAAAVTEPVRGHPMTRLRLEGRVQAGVYLMTAYGGPPLAWADGAVDQPFHLRAGASDALAEGWTGGTVSPLGSDLFLAPADRTVFRLDLLTAAAATLTVDGRVAAIAPNSHEPSATLSTSSNRALVEVAGVAGQPYTLRALERSSRQTWAEPGTWWLSATALGTGGDEVPPTVLLTREQTGQPAAVVAGNVRRIAADTPLRTRFNLRGPTTLLLQNALLEVLAVRNAGSDVGPLGIVPQQWQLPQDYIRYGVAPASGKQGVADLLFGREGAAVAAAVPLPADPVVPLGVHSVERGQPLRLYANTGPGVSIGLIGRPAPVALAEGALTLTQGAGAAMDVPVALAPGGRLVVTQPGAGDVPHSVRPQRDDSIVVTLPAPERPRTVVLAWRRPVLARPDIELPAERTMTALAARRPHYLDLKRGEAQEFNLDVAEGGLYRVETLGRLQTAGAIGTAFIPALDRGEANGVGRNMLVQRWLRAGRYRVAVSAQESAGRLGFVATPAPLHETPALVPGGSIRARLPAGTGLRAVLEIPETGRYRLDLRGLGRTFTARVDDAEGWPLQAPQALTEFEEVLQAGRYGLMVSPEAVEARVVGRLVRVASAPERAGHGLHPLPFEAVQRHTWREPPGRDDPRTPDAWTFALAGSADTTLRVGDGMVADLRRDGQERPVARLVGPIPFKGRLEAGSYRLEAMSLGRNDRLDYDVKLSTTELQPGVPRSVGVSASVPFVLAEPRVVSLTTFGDVALKAVLRDTDGAEVARYGDRGSDWNIGISRPLPAGAYRLELQPSVPPAGADTPPAQTSPVELSDARDDGGEAQTAEPASRRSDPEDGEAEEADADERSVELRLALPETRASEPAGAAATAMLGGGVHRLTLAQPEAGSLVVASAASSAEVVLVLERQASDSTWDTVALAQGTAPALAAPSDGGAAPWRASVWTLDGGTEPVRAALQAVVRSAQQPGRVVLSALDGSATPLAVARVALEAAELVTVEGGVLAGGWPGHALTATGDAVAAQSDRLWLLAPEVRDLVATRRPSIPGTTMAVPVPAGGMARLGAPPVPNGQVRAWVAASGLGQPSLDAGQGMGVAAGSALALGQSARVWDADGRALTPRVTAHDLLRQPSRTLDAPFAGLIEPGEAMPVRLPAGLWQLSLALAPGIGAVAGWDGPNAVTVWGGDAAVSRLVSGEGEVLLLNVGPTAAPAALSWTPAGVAEPLQAGRVIKRFFGMAGSFDLPLDTAKGSVLVVAGDASAVVRGADGQVRRGRRVALAGPGRVTVDHAAGPVAAWVEANGTDPWPVVAPQPLALPARMPIDGAAMALRVAPGGPVLLRARTTAPVILRIDGPPKLFAAGADISRYVAGATVLRLDSPHDGPLSGTLEVSADPVTPISEGLGAAVALPPGGSAVFGFRLSRTAHVGVGVRAEPDRAELRLLDGSGTVMGEGNALLRRLPAGQYVLEAHNAGDSTAVLRPAVLGITPRGSGPPPEVARRYLELVGLAPKETP